MRSIKKIISIFLLLVFILPYKTSFADYNQTNAVTYLNSHANSPWSVMALKAAGANLPNLDFLKNISTSNAIDLEAPILALSSAGVDAKTYSSTNYVDKLKSFFNNNQIGDESTLNDDSFGILALTSAGESKTDPVIVGAKNFLQANQNQDGGFSYVVSGSSDSNSTASAVLALIAAGVSGNEQSVQKALEFLKSCQNPDGGFKYDTNSTASDTSSTAWAIWAYTAASIPAGTLTTTNGDAITYIKNNQTEVGFFKYQSLGSEDSFSAVTTAYAVIALTGNFLPIKSVSTSENSGGNPTLSFPFRIEGSSEMLCSGSAPGTSALDVLKNAATICLFDLNIKSTSYGPYVEKINADAASGNNGWMYLVNNIMPDVGAADYKLKNGDEVLWYFGDYTWQPTKLSLETSDISSGQAARVKLEYFNGQTWQPLSNADVFFGSLKSLTDSSGFAEIKAPDGYYKIYAEKMGYIRSNAALLKIGQTNSSVNLSANITLDPQVKGTSTQDTITFTVDTKNLDFGNLNPGQTKSLNLSITNSGNKSITIFASVFGSELFKNNLLLNNVYWQKFKSNFSANQSNQISSKLSAPQNIILSGAQNGQLVFWALANNN